MARTPFRDRPIKQKLRIVTLIIITIMGLIAISGDVAKEYLALHSEARNKMAVLSSILAQASVAGITFNDTKEAEKELALLRTVQNITSATIYLADGAEFAGYKRKDTDEKEFTGYFYKDLHSLSQPILVDGRALGRIEVKWELQEEYKKLLLYLFMVVTLTFIFAPLISLFLIERLMQAIIKPIAVLSGSAAEIGKGNLSHRVEVASKDEIGQLAASFNRMTEDLQTTTVSMELLIREVEERQKVEAVLKNKDAEWQNTFDSISDFVSLHTLDFKFMRVNKALADFLGVTPEETIGRPCYELYHGLNEPLNDCPVHAMLESRQPETREVSEPGRGLFLLVTTSPVFDRKGAMIASVHIAKDITERKKMEAALQASEARFRHLSEATFEGVAISESGLIQDANNSFVEMLGYEKLEEVVGKNALEFTAPESRELVAKHIEQGYEKPYEATAMRKDGSVMLVEIRGRMMEISGGRRFRFTAIRDITERKRAEEELKRSNTDLEQFSYAISHDMRQPLRMISSYLQLLETVFAGQLDSEKREWFNFAIDGAKRLDQMLLSLLEYSRVGRKGAPLAWIESRELLSEALLFLKADLAKAAAGLRITGDWPRIFASHDEVVRLLQNLLGNALKFRVAGRTPEINIYSETVEKEWHLSISDNGVGIAPEQIGRLFQVFQRVQLRTAYEGTGIGLALCRKIVEHHRGIIWAESAGEGKGSIFKVILPIDNAGGGG